MAENTGEMRTELLDRKGPELMERLEMSELFLTHLVSKQVITAVEKQNLKVSR